MRLTLKWLLWFIGIGIYVMCLGGVFYYNLFKWTFDEKLKQDILDTVKIYAPTIRNGLLNSPRVTTLDEYDIMTSLQKDERITSLLYLSRQGTVRWHKESRFIGISWDEYQKTVPSPTDAIDQALKSKMPKSRQVANEPFYEIAIPFSVRGDIIGIIDLLVSRAGAKVLIGSAMRKYVFGALGVLFLLGLPLYFFFHHYVISPMGTLRDSIEAISLKNFDLRFPAKSDEIGDLALAITVLLGKMKTEIDSILNRDKKYKEAEQKWWRSLLHVIVPGNNYVIVVDENNNILYANFELAHGMDAKNIHLLDVVDSQQQNLLRLVGQAFETPDQSVEGETVFKDQELNVKVLHVGESSGINRTLILFYPKAGIQA
jgi:HAMP domain-containing protein